MKRFCLFLFLTFFLKTYSNKVEVLIEKEKRSLFGSALLILVVWGYFKRDKIKQKLSIFAFSEKNKEELLDQDE